MHRLNDRRRAGTRKSFREREQIYARGSPCEFVYIVDAGELINVVVSPEGHELVIQRAGKGDIVPLTGLLLLQDGAAYRTDCIAQTECKVTEVAASEVRAILAKRPELTLHLFDLSLKRLRERTQQFADCALLSVHSRVCEWLLQSARKQGIKSSNSIVLDEHYSKRLIGLFLGGVSRESISRELSALSRAGLINRNGGHITLMDISGLTRWSAKPRRRK
jgi:CRP-like cAMP-binding protein